MKRDSFKKKKTPERDASERPEESRSSRAPQDPRKQNLQLSPRKELRVAAEDHCVNCDKALTEDSRTLFVEEEVGRVFCSEACIVAFFAPDIERLEHDYFEWLSPDDLPAELRDELSYLRWDTLADPIEVWREKTLKGDCRYSLISEFEPNDVGQVWCICICLALKWEPSFLFLAMITRDPKLVEHYRRGEAVDPSLMRKKEVASGRDAGDKEESSPKGESEEMGVSSESNPFQLVDGLANSWTEEEAMRAEMVHYPGSNDIPADQHGDYDEYFTAALENPDEVWVQDPEAVALDSEATDEEESAEDAEENSRRTFHFLKFYDSKGRAPGKKKGSKKSRASKDTKDAFWYIIVARDVPGQDQIEIVDAFPTRDNQIASRYRRGTQEVGVDQEINPDRMIH